MVVRKSVNALVEAEYRTDSSDLPDHQLGYDNARRLPPTVRGRIYETSMITHLQRERLFLDPFGPPCGYWLYEAISTQTTYAEFR